MSGVSNYCGVWNFELYILLLHNYAQTWAEFSMVFEGISQDELIVFPGAFTGLCSVKVVAFNRHFSYSKFVWVQALPQL